MHNIPPSPRRSIAATPKAQKKVGAPKAKGAVRAKSGCYTCRIRRKKCDEQPNEEGRCQTCVRLRLQCLGFGQKRPEWLKENNNVTVFREKIKDFLAAQGMIKGHSGSGARSPEQEGMLMLVSESSGQSESSSPPTPTLSSTSSDDHRHATSYVRDGHYPALSMQSQPSYNTTAFHSMQDSLSPDSPLDPSRGGHMLASTGDPLLSFGMSTIMTPSSNSLVPMSTTWPNNQPAFPASSSCLMPPSTFTSTLPNSYQQSFYDEGDDLSEGESTRPEYFIPPSLSTSILPFIPEHQNGLVRHYLDHVLMRQYLLADKSISEFIIRTIQTSPAVRDAVCLLASLHQQSWSQGRLTDISSSFRDTSDADDGKTYSRICTSLTRARQQSYTEDEALTGLLVVSAFLFRGGRGAWQQFLSVASDWVEGMLRRYADTADLLFRCSESQRFIIKTTFWFDILASTTKLEPPRFLVYYQRLWRASGAYIEDPMSSSPHLSMLTIMGCENATALAIAEISNLACWKDVQTKRGTLSMPQLVDRGKEIEDQYLQPYGSPTQLTHIDAISYGSAEDEMAMRRRLTSNIFRATAKVYLHTVLSGDCPGCPEIRESVAETIACLKSVPTMKTSLSSSVVRSVVFGICLCGCLTDEYEERAFILQRLEDEQREGVGNCREARRVMERVWERRAAGGKPMSWREAMEDLGADSLLLV